MCKNVTVLFKHHLDVDVRVNSYVYWTSRPGLLQRWKSFHGDLLWTLSAISLEQSNSRVSCYCHKVQNPSYLCASPLPRADTRGFTFSASLLPHKKIKTIRKVSEWWDSNLCAMQPRAAVFDNGLARRDGLTFDGTTALSPLLPNLFSRTSHFAASRLSHSKAGTSRCHS